MSYQVGCSSVRAAVDGRRRLAADCLAVIRLGHPLSADDLPDRPSTRSRHASNGVVRGACPHDCPDTCAMLVTVEDGRAVRVAGDPDHPFTRGFLCAKVNRYVERTYHRRPAAHAAASRRAQRAADGSSRSRGTTRSTRSPTRLRDIADSSDGPQAILPYSYAGTMGLLQGSSMDRRFFHLLGASRLDRTICSMAGTVGMRMTVGANIGADAEGIPQSDLVLLWGTNTLTANPHLWPFVLAGARARRADHLHRSRSGRAPRRSATSGSRSGPGTDARAGARDDARAVRARARGSRLPRAAHARPRGAARARRGVDAGAHRGGHRACARRRSSRSASATAARARRSFA